MDQFAALSLRRMLPHIPLVFTINDHDVIERDVRLTMMLSGSAFEFSFKKKGEEERKKKRGNEWEGRGRRREEKEC